MNPNEDYPRVGVENVPSKIDAGNVIFYGTILGMLLGVGVVAWLVLCLCVWAGRTAFGF